MMAEYISYGALYLAEAVIAWRYFEALFCRRASGLRVGLSFAAAYILLFCATWLDSVVLNGAAFFRLPAAFAADGLRVPMEIRRAA